MKFLIALVFICIATSSNADTSSDISGLEQYKLTFNGLGPFRIGMSLKEAEATGFKFELHDEEAESCRQATVKSNPDVRLMFEEGILTRVEIVGASISTLSGIRVGFTEAWVRRVYGSRIVVERHQYDQDGHYMKVFSADRKRALVIETDGKIVGNFQAGNADSAQYVEGCL